MIPYNIKNIENGLQEVAKDIKGKDINTVAFFECVDPGTVRVYLKGEVTFPAIGKGILDRCRELIKEKEAA